MYTHCIVVSFVRCLFHPDFAILRIVRAVCSVDMRLFPPAFGWFSVCIFARKGGCFFFRASSTLTVFALGPVLPLFPSCVLLPFVFRVYLFCVAVFGPGFRGRGKRRTLRRDMAEDSGGVAVDGGAVEAGDEGYWETAYDEEGNTYYYHTVSGEAPTAV